MKCRKIFIGLLFIISLVTTSEIFAQIKITKSNTAYYYEENKIDLCFYVVKNISDSCIFLWFNKEKDSAMTLQERVHSYFFIPQGDFSFFSLLSELSVGTATPSKGEYVITVGFSFIKELKPNQSFTIILKDKSIDSFSEDFIEIVPCFVFEQANKFGRWFENYEYKADFIVF